MEIIQEVENSLINRKEIRVIVEAEKNPSYEEATDIIARQFNTGKELVVIKQVKGKFGRKLFNQYHNIEYVRQCMLDLLSEN